MCYITVAGQNPDEVHRDQTRTKLVRVINKITAKSNWFNNKSVNSSKTPPGNVPRGSKFKTRQENS